MASLAIVRLIICLATVTQLISLVYCLMAYNERHQEKASPIIEMKPNTTQRIVSEGNFNISCRIIMVNVTDPSVNIGDITWILPKTIEHYKENLLKRAHDGENLTLSTTLNILNATSKGTGYYSCLYKEAINSSAIGNLNITQYIYIKGMNLLTVASLEIISATLRGDLMKAEKGFDFILPCVATQPNVNISIFRSKYIDDHLYVDHVKKEDLFEQIKPSTNSDVTYDYNRGLILKNVRVSDSGTYKCCGSLLDITSEILVDLVVRGTELEVVGGGHDEIEEGNNVTLVCTTSYGSTIRWKYGKNNVANLTEFNETHPPIGLEPPKLNISLHPKILRDFSHSTLQFFNVTRKFYSTYECEGSNFHYGNSNRISLRFKSKEKDPEIKKINRGMQTTMLCTTTEDATDFQWFKNNHRINITGQQTNHITFCGDPNDAGLYECIYVDGFGHEQQMAYKVIITRFESNNQPSLPIFSIFLSVFLLCILVRTFTTVFKNIFYYRG